MAFRHVLVALVVLLPLAIQAKPPPDAQLRESLRELLSDLLADQPAHKNYRRKTQSEFEQQQIRLRKEFEEEFGKRQVFWMLSNSQRVAIYPTACLEGCTYEVEIKNEATGEVEDLGDHAYTPGDSSTYEIDVDIDADQEYEVKVCREDTGECEVWECDTRAAKRDDVLSDNICSDLQQTDFSRK